METFIVKYQIPLISFNSQQYEIKEFTDYHEASRFAQDKALIKRKQSGKVVFGKVNDKGKFQENYYGCTPLTHIEIE
jgi:hypothetical protein